ncbi:phosphatase PAP2 family protein [Streptomyces sp. NBC_00704]|uniref:phosphatase PAP2 family protein n=1 Tax=Streptomyces sp. NBC_00704 TaxID=2975809 RepID=UPI002E311DD8|nr:phosphatase PAP2 family protein [Streptomyces sp. NBC_00704]
MTGRSAHPVLPPVLRGWLGTVAGLAGLSVALLGILYAGGSEPGGVDRRISSPEADGVGPPWRRLALALDFLGEPVGSVLLVAVLVAGCLLLRRPRAAVLTVAGAGAGVAVATLLKHLVGRTIHGDGNLSYPSGHTTFATALALAVALLATGLLGLGRTAGMALVLGFALVAGAAMGWAQVALGAHYPTDALGGFFTALAVVPATGWLVDRAARRPEGGPDDRPDVSLDDRPDASLHGGPDDRPDASLHGGPDDMSGRTSG